MSISRRVVKSLKDGIKIAISAFIAYQERREIIKLIHSNGMAITSSGRVVCGYCKLSCNDHIKTSKTSHWLSLLHAPRARHLVRIGEIKQQ